MPIANRAYAQDEGRCSGPLFFAGEVYSFYINGKPTSDPDFLNFQLRLVKNDAALTVFASNIGALNKHTVTAPFYNIWSQFKFPNAPLGYYRLQIWDSVKNVVKVTSNLIEVEEKENSKAIAKVFWRNRFNKYDFQYETLPNYYNIMTIALVQVGNITDTNFAQYRNDTDEQLRNFPNYAEEVIKLETYKYSEGMHRAAMALFEHDTVFVNSTFVTKKDGYTVEERRNAVLTSGLIAVVPNRSIPNPLTNLLFNPISTKPKLGKPIIGQFLIFGGTLYWEWSFVLNANKYEWYLYKASSLDAPNLVAAGNTTPPTASAAITTAVPGTNFYFLVRAVDTNGDYDTGDFAMYTFQTRKAVSPVIQPTGINQNGFILNWAIDTAANRARIEISTDPTFASTVATGDGSNSGQFFFGGGNPATMYYYRVQQYASPAWYLASDWSTGSKLTDAGAVQLNTPIIHNIHLLVGNAEVLVDATDEANATQYEFEFSDNNIGNGNVILRATRAISEVTASLNPNYQPFYVRVRALGGAGYTASPFGPWVAFAGVKYDTPAPITFAAITATSFNALWPPAADANQFQSDISTDNAFNTIVGGNSGSNSGVSQFFSGAQGQTYYVRVKQYDSDNWNQRSDYGYAQITL